MTQLWQVKIGGNTFSPADWTSSDNLYSTVEFGTGSQQELTAFSYGRGGYIPGSPTQRKSELVDTNLEGEGGRLPENEAVLIYSISADFFHTPSGGFGGDDDNVQAPNLGVRNMLRIHRDIVAQLQIASLQKIYKQSGIGFFAAGMGVESGFASGTGQNPAQGFAAAFNGATSIKGVRKFASPEFIKGGETFGVVLKFPTGSVEGLTLNGNANDRVTTRIWLRGIRKRPVA
jgi:hypothetical protein